MILLFFNALRDERLLSSLPTETPMYNDGMGRMYSQINGRAPLPAPPIRHC